MNTSHHALPTESVCCLICREYQKVPFHDWTCIKCGQEYRYLADATIFLSQDQLQKLRNDWFTRLAEGTSWGKGGAAEQP